MKKGERAWRQQPNHAARSPARFRPSILIDGKWRDSVSGKTFETINPATEEVITEVAEGDAADIDLAVKAARKAFDTGPGARWMPATADA